MTDGNFQNGSFLSHSHFTLINVSGLHIHIYASYTMHLICHHLYQNVRHCILYLLMLVSSSYWCDWGWCHHYVMSNKIYILRIYTLLHISYLYCASYHTFTLHWFVRHHYALCFNITQHTQNSILHFFEYNH